MQTNFGNSQFFFGNRDHETGADGDPDLGFDSIGRVPVEGFDL